MSTVNEICRGTRKTSTTEKTSGKFTYVKSTYRFNKQWGAHQAMDAEEMLQAKAPNVKARGHTSDHQWEQERTQPIAPILAPASNCSSLALTDELLCISSFPSKWSIISLCRDRPQSESLNFRIDATGQWPSRYSHNEPAIGLTASPVHPMSLECLALRHTSCLNFIDSHFYGCSIYLFGTARLT